MPDRSNETFQPVTGDMSPEEFRMYGHQVIDWIADFLAHPEQFPVLSQAQPGDIKKQLPASPPAVGEPMEEILRDVNDIIVPGLTHWNHPAFLAYFGISASGPGILGELLSAAFNVNAMLWKTSPAATELEEVTLDWLRQMIGLPAEFRGIIYDTASMSTMHAIAAAREYAGLHIREKGMAGRCDTPRLRLYTSEQAHSSVEKGAIALGIGQEGVRKIGVDDEFRMRPDLLEQAVTEDIADGWKPFCVVATAGTTSTTSVDPVPEIADVCEKFNLWLHVDAAYGGSPAILPEMKWVLNGCDRAHSLVTNPHKWLFTPIDLSAFFCRRFDVLKQAFSLVPEYLKTTADTQATNLMDYGVQLGRRFRALKLWMIIRYFGQEGLSDLIRRHIKLAHEFASWVRESPDFELMAPVPFSTVCFRAILPGMGKTEAGMGGAQSGMGELQAGIDEMQTGMGGIQAGTDGIQVGMDEMQQGIDEAQLTRLNETILERVNATGRVFLSHTALHGHFTLRLAIGNIRTTEEHVTTAWELLRETAASVLEEMGR